MGAIVRPSLLRNIWSRYCISNTKDLGWFDSYSSWWREEDNFDTGKDLNRQNSARNNNMMRSGDWWLERSLCEILYTPNFWTLS